jgi:hypothetical protein
VYGDVPEAVDRGMLLSIYTCFFHQIKDTGGLLIKPLGEIAFDPQPRSIRRGAEEVVLDKAWEPN